MDTRDGRIYQAESLNDFDPEDRPYMQEMDTPPSIQQRKRMKIGRNDPCPCGSRQKFKKCCMFKMHMGVAR